MKYKLLGLVLLGIFLAVSNVYAAEFIAPRNGNITLPASETHTNLYAAGGNVIINSRTANDLYVAGGSVNIAGPVDDSAHIAGGNLNISSTVGSDLMAAGGNIYITETSRIGGDLVLAGGNLDIEAPVSGSAKIAGGMVEINSSINGDVIVTAKERLTFGSKAQVNGKIVYYGNVDPVIEPGASVGSIERHPLRVNKFDKGLFGAGIAISILAWLAAALTFVYLFRSSLAKAVGIVRAQPLKNLGIGFVSLIITPILALVLFVLFVGYYLAFILLSVYILALLIAGLVAAVFLGDLLLRWIDKSAVKIDWKTALLGVLAFKLLTLIPIIGWIICIVLTLSAFGATLRLTKSQIRPE